ncbi:MAG: toxin-antitoxin system YwqK family antitoxin, partial [Flavobacteriales bacterium]
HTEIGNFANGKKDGVWKHFYRNGQLKFKGKYVDGMPVEEHVWFHKNGKEQLIGEYSAGVKDGKWKRYNKKGELILTIEYEKGKEKKVDGRKLKGSG